MVRRSDEWVSAQVGDELVMMSVQDGKYIGLGGVGGRIWELLAEPRAEDELCALLLREFEVDEQTCRAEVATFVAELREHGALAD